MFAMARMAAMVSSAEDPLLDSFHFPLFFQQQLYKILICSQTANRILNLRVIHFWIGFRR